jgi:hypothetical protein
MVERYPLRLCVQPADLPALCVSFADLNRRVCIWCAPERGARRIGRSLSVRYVQLRNGDWLARDRCEKLYKGGFNAIRSVFRDAVVGRPTAGDDGS